MNAFKYGCAVEGENFCARPELSKSLRSLIMGGQNLVVQGERRIGKTSLVRETVSSMRGWSMVYVDFMGVRSVADVCNRLADALARFDSSDTFLRKILAALLHLRPMITVDAMTGLPTITVDARASVDPISVNTMMNALEDHVKNRKVCVAFDEFQDVLGIKDGNQVLALMRSRIQFMSRTAFVFLGSVRNQMLDIFMSPKSPFYKAAALFDVGLIPSDDFYAFAAARFATGRRKLPREIFDRILLLSNGTSGDVQELCDAIWQVSSRGDTLTDDQFEQGVRLIFHREGASYVTFAKPLTDIQYRVLHALALKGGRHPAANAFLEAAGVSNVTSVKRALVALEKAELIYQHMNEWKFASPFFREWIRRK